MAKQKLVDARYDYRQGLNTIVSPDMLNPSESVQMINARIDSAFGGVSKRTGTRRMHATAVGSPSAIQGLVQWDCPDCPGGAGPAKQIVATAADGKLYHKVTAFGAFTQVTPATTFSGTRQTFAPFRSIAASSPLVLYIAGNRLYSWDGTAITVMAPSGLPTDISIIAAHATRMFAKSIANPKNLYWSKVGDATNWSASGLPTDGGTAPVQVLTGESINALEVVGGSLLIATEDSISRFTGSSSDNISLATDTFGLSTEVGSVGVYGMKKFETAVALLTERGPYVVTESGIVPIGIKVEPEFLNITPANLTTEVVGYHRGRKELWFAIPGPNDGGLNKTVYVYSTRLQAWMGPWVYPFGINAFARYEDLSTGAENLMAGCSDGFVRLMDDVGSYLDDRLSDGTGGSAIAMQIELAPHFFETGAGVVKTLSGMELDAQIVDNDNALRIRSTFEEARSEVIVPSAGWTNYLLQSNAFNTGSWNKLNITVAPDDITSPFGEVKADKLTATATAATLVNQSLTAPSSIVTYSIYARAVALTSAEFGIFNNTTVADVVFVSVNLLTGAITVTSGTGTISAKAMPDGLGWWRIVITNATGITPGNTISCYAGFTGGTYSAGSSIHVYGAQLQTGASVSPALETFGTILSSGVLPYRVDIRNQGKRGRIEFLHASASPISILGYKLEAYDMNRP